MVSRSQPDGSRISPRIGKFQGLRVFSSAGKGPGNSAGLPVDAKHVVIRQNGKYGFLKIEM
jgi:hypothetical protein